MKNLKKYLTKYAEPEVSSLTGFPKGHNYKHSVVIPAYKEKSDFLENIISSTLISESVLIVVVINQPDTEFNHGPQLNLHKSALGLGIVIWQHENLSLVKLNQSHSAILVVDRFTFPIPQKQGVGLARKVGVDITCQLIFDNIIKSQWIHSTDADAKLPANYFSCLNQHDSKNVIGACYNFTHKSHNKMLEQANGIYEQALRYYVAGLTYAGSNNNFFSIGSILAFKVDGYINVRGFPKRSAGEDFYLLNKLAKLGDIITLDESVITLEARMSDRVPFGTGPAIKNIIELSEQGMPYTYYAPEVFFYLKEALTAFTCLFYYRNDLMDWYQQYPEQVRVSLVDIGFESFVVKHCKDNETQFTKQLYTWFDAFKTLKFIHSLRDHYFSNIPLEQALAKAQFNF